MDLLNSYKKIGDSALTSIAKLQSLNFLYLKNTRISGSGLKKLRSLKKLKWLNLISTKLSDQWMPDLSHLRATGTEDHPIKRKLVPILIGKADFRSPSLSGNGNHGKSGSNQNGVSEIDKVDNDPLKNEGNDAHRQRLSTSGNSDTMRATASSRSGGMADALDSKSSEGKPRGGSSPPSGILYHPMQFGAKPCQNPRFPREILRLWMLCF